MSSATERKSGDGALRLGDKETHRNPCCPLFFKQGADRVHSFNHFQMQATKSHGRFISFTTEVNWA